MKAMAFETDQNQEDLEKIERLQQKMAELTRRLQKVPIDGGEFRQISSMLDEVVEMLRRALQQEYKTCSNTYPMKQNQRLH